MALFFIPLGLLAACRGLQEKGLRSLCAGSGARIKWAFSSLSLVKWNQRQSPLALGAERLEERLPLSLCVCRAPGHPALSGTGGSAWVSAEWSQTMSENQARHLTQEKQHWVRVQKDSTQHNLETYFLSDFESLLIPSRNGEGGMQKEKELCFKPNITFQTVP